MKVTLAFPGQAELDAWRAASDAEAGYPKNIARASDGADMGAVWGQTASASGDIPLGDDGIGGEAGAVVRDGDQPAAPGRWLGFPLRRDAALEIDEGPLALDESTLYLE